MEIPIWTFIAKTGWHLRLRAALLWVTIESVLGVYQIPVPCVSSPSCRLYLAPAAYPTHGEDWLKALRVPLRTAITYWSWHRNFITQLLYWWDRKMIMWKETPPSYSHLRRKEFMFRTLFCPPGKLRRIHPVTFWLNFHSRLQKLLHSFAAHPWNCWRFSQKWRLRHVLSSC